MGSIVTVVLSAILSFIFFAPVGQTTQTTSGIVGVVVDTAGDPVEGVKVIAKDTQGNVVTAVTDAEGQYVITDLTVGEEYVLELESFLYEPAGPRAPKFVLVSGVTVNWTVSRALAHPDLAATPAEALGADVIAAIVVLDGIVPLGAILAPTIMATQGTDSGTRTTSATPSQ